MSNECGCEACRLHEQLAAALKERDYYKRMATRMAEMVDRTNADYAERVMLEQLEARTA